MRELVVCVCVRICAFGLMALAEHSVEAQRVPSSPLLSAPIFNGGVPISPVVKARVKKAVTKRKAQHGDEDEDDERGALEQRKEQNRLAASKHRLICKQRDVEFERRIKTAGIRNAELRSMIEAAREEIQQLKAALLAVHRDRCSAEPVQNREGSSVVAC